MGLGRKAVATGRRKRDEADNIDIFAAGFQKASGAKIESNPTKVRSTAMKAVPSEPEAVLEESGFLTAKERENVKMHGSALLSISNALPSQMCQHSLPRKVPPVIPVSKRMMGTSARSALLYDALRAGQELCADSDRNKAWEIQTYSVFKSSNVVWWPEAKVGSGKDKSFRLLGSTNRSPVHATSLADLRTPLSDGETNVASGKMRTPKQDESDDELPDLLASVRKIGNPHKPSLGNHATTPHQQEAQKDAGKVPIDTEHTVISIDDSDEDMNGGPASPKVASGAIAADTPGQAEPTQNLMDLEDSFDDDLDSSVWLAVNLDPRQPSSSTKIEGDEHARPLSPELATIVCQFLQSLYGVLRLIILG